MTSLITTNDALIAACNILSHSDVLFVDTEFLREKTYYAQLCLVQLAGCDGDAVAIDTLAQGLDLAPLFALLYNPDSLKVMHAGRQDIEIIVQLGGNVPAPYFDTQIAAMVLGLGEQIGYSALVQHYLSLEISKTQQFTDWSRRPLQPKQLDYALDDVRYLRDCYPLMLAELTRLNRMQWVEEETAPMLEASLYITEPEDAWQRIKKRDIRPRVLARLRALAAWREREAIRKNIPRGRILRDDCVQQLALSNPTTLDAVAKTRGVPNHPRMQQAILDAVISANGLPIEDCPHLPRPKAPAKEMELLRELLKLLLKLKATEHEVSPRLIASSEDIDALVKGERDVACLHGRRAIMFGNDAVNMLEGKLSLIVEQQQLLCKQSGS